MIEIEISEIRRRLTAIPKRISAAVEAAPVNELRSKRNGNDFSILEHACHLREIEELAYYPRISRILAEDVPSLPSIHGDALAVEHRYRAKDVNEVGRLCRAAIAYPCPDRETGRA